MSIRRLSLPPGAAPLSLFPLFVTLFLASGSVRLAADEAKSPLESVSLGEVLFGPKVNLEDLKGRVVLIEFWGRN